MTLAAVGSVALPPFRPSRFDHGDVDLASGRIFLAHTAQGTIEVVDGERLEHLATVPGCPEASGVLCLQENGWVIAAARAGGRVLILDAGNLSVRGELPTGPKPNGLAWSERRRTLLVADVEDHQARLLAPDTGHLVGQVGLPGRPRWCVHHGAADRFLVNVRAPACVAVVGGSPPAMIDCWAVSSTGPHGLDLDVDGGRAFVATDGGAVVSLDLVTGREIGSATIAGSPDAIWYNPVRGLLYVAIGEPGVVDVIDTAAMRHRQQLVTEAGAHTTAFDRERQRLAVFLPGSCQAAVYEETGA